MPDAAPFRIVADPAADFVSPDTIVNYEIEATQPHVKLDDVRFAWHRLPDPTARKPWGNPLTGRVIQMMPLMPTVGPRGTGEARWRLGLWEVPGQHLVVCRVTDKGKTYDIRYPQRVVPMSTELEKGVAVPRHGVDPVAFRDRLAEKLQTLKYIEAVAPTQESRREEAEEQLERYGDALDRLDVLIEDVRGKKTFAIGARHLATETGDERQLNICAAYLGPGQWVIIDFTSLFDSRFSGRWEGRTLAEAERDWSRWKSARYPRGHVQYSYDIRGLPRVKDRTFTTTGSTLADDLVMAGGLLGAALMVAVPVFGLGAALFATGALTSVASATYSIVDRHRDGFHDWRADAFDVLAIVSTVAGGIGAFGRFGIGARVLVAGRAYRALVAVDVVATGADALLLSETTLESILRAMARTDKTPEERLGLIVEIVRTAAAVTFAVLNFRAATAKPKGGAPEPTPEPLHLEGRPLDDQLEALRDTQPAIRVSELQEAQTLQRLHDPRVTLEVDETPAMRGHTERGAHETTINPDDEPTGSRPLKPVPPPARLRADDEVYETVRRIWLEENEPEVPGWDFKDKPFEQGRQIRTIFYHLESKTSGRVVRELADDGTLVMEEAFRGKAPAFILHDGVRMDAKRGTKTIAYLTMRQMHKLGVKFASLRKVKMSNIQNLRTIAELDTHLKTMTLDEAAWRTHSVAYGREPLEMSGHKLVSVHVVGGTREPFGKLMAHYEASDASLKAVHDALLSAHGLTRESVVLTKFDIYLRVEPARTASH